MKESWDDDDVGYIDPDDEEAINRYFEANNPYRFVNDEFSGCRDQQKEEPNNQAGAPFDPSLVDPALLGYGAHHAPTQTMFSGPGPGIGLTVQPLDSQPPTAVQNQDSFRPGLAGSTVQNVQTPSSFGAPRKSRQAQNLRLQTAPREPGPPPDQIAMDAVMGNTGNFLGATDIDLSSYVDDGPQRGYEDDQAYTIRMQRATQNMNLERRRIPTGGHPPAGEDDLEFNEWRLDKLETLAKDWEQHRQRITVGGPEYDQIYHMTFLQREMERQQRNKERRARALQARRELESVNHLERVPTPSQYNNDGGEELYNWGVDAPLPQGYHPRLEADQILIELGIREEDDQPRNKGKGKATDNEPGGGAQGGLPADLTSFMVTRNDYGPERTYGLNNPSGNAPTGFGGIAQPYGYALPYGSSQTISGHSDSPPPRGTIDENGNITLPAQAPTRLGPDFRGAPPRDFGLNNPFGNAPTGFGPDFASLLPGNGFAPPSYGSSSLHPPRPVIDNHGNMISPNNPLLPLSGGRNQSYQNNQIPPGAPTQRRIGLPDASYLPKGYAWSDFRCNNCSRLRQPCDAFPKKASKDIGKERGTKKDLSNTLISFPCSRCRRNPSLAATCTWSIGGYQRSTTGPRYWTGARVIEDPGFATRPTPRNKYERYKEHNVLPDGRLEPSPWGIGMPPPRQNLGNAAILTARAPATTVQRRAPTRRPRQAAQQMPPGPSGGQAGDGSQPGRGPTTATQQQNPRRPARCCSSCASSSDEGIRNSCDIAQKHPCSRCEFRGEFCVEDKMWKSYDDENDDDEDNEDEDEDDNDDEYKGPGAKKPKRGGRIQSTLTVRSKIAKPTSRNTRVGATGKGITVREATQGMTLRGERQLKSRMSSPIQRKGEAALEAAVNEALGVKSPLDDDEVLEDFDDFDDSHVKHGGGCVFCREHKYACDERRPCGNCAAQGIICEIAASIPYQPLQFPVLERPAVASSPTMTPPTATEQLWNMLGGDGSEGFGEKIADATESNVWGNNTDWLECQLAQIEAEEAAEQDETSYINPFQTVQSTPPFFDPQPQPFATIQSQNAAQEKYEAAIEPEDRAMVALEQNFAIEGRASPPPGPYIMPHPIIEMFNKDDEMSNNNGLPPQGNVLPLIAMGIEYTGAESCENIDGCHEFDSTAFSIQGIAARCDGRPTKPCSVIGHSQFCICTNCRAMQDYFANNPIQGNRSQLGIIEDAKAYYCMLCANLARYEHPHGGNTKYGSCTCTGQMTRAWLCNGHRTRALEMVKRRTLLMQEWVARKRGGGGLLPCARCQEHPFDAQSGAWECAVCRDKIITPSTRPVVDDKKSYTKKWDRF